MNDQAGRHKRRAIPRGPISTFVAAIAAMALGLLVSAFPSGREMLDKYSILFSVFIAVSFALLMLVGMFELFLEVREERRGKAAILQRLENRDSLQKSVSTLVTFVERREKITVTDDGDGIFDCTYRVVYDPGDDANSQSGFVENLHFPVVIDLPSEQETAGANVHVRSIQVDEDQIPVDGRYVPQELRRRITPDKDGPTSPAQEYGVVIVPVSMSASRSERRVRIVTEYKSIFKARFSQDYVIVDIPYLTRSLEVTICAGDPDSAIWPPARASVLEATCEMMDLSDVSEALEQSRNLSRENHGIKWTTTRSKIGYRYKIYFKVIPAGAKPHDAA